MTRKFQVVARTTLAAAGVLALTATMSTAAVADESSADSVAAQIAAVAPDQGDVVAPLASGDNFAVDSAGVTIEVPSSPTAAVTMTQIEAQTGASAQLGQLEVYLPVETALTSATVADDGTVVFESADDLTSVAVQILDDGSARLQTVSHDAASPTEFTYTFGENISLRSLPDGTVAVSEATAGGSIITYATVAAPWAIDSEGQSVPTHYVVDDNALAQVLEPSPETVYPIVADPKLTFGTRIYWSLTRTEQLYFGSMGSWAAAAYLCGQTAGLACAAAAAAATGIGLYLASNGGACPTSAAWLQIGFPYGYPVNTWPGPSMSCRVKV